MKTDIVFPAFLIVPDVPWGGPVVWAGDFHVGGLKFETPCQRKQGFAFWVEFVIPDLPSARYLSYVVCEILHRSGGFT